MIDMEAGARVAGSRFAYLKGDLVLLELALFRWALELLGTHGFEPVVPPVLVREEALYGTGFLPDTEQQIYRLRRRRPVPRRHERGAAGVAARRRDRRRRTGCRCATPASRRASGARRAPPGATRAASCACTSSTRSRCSASSSRRRRATSTSCCSRSRRSCCASSGIPYRVVNIGADDLGASAAKKYDLEAWMPGQEQLPRGHVDLEHDRLPGAPARHPLPRGRRQAAPRAHAQRHRGHLAPPDRAARERPARRRHRRGAGGAAGVGCAGAAAGR